MDSYVVRAAEAEEVSATPNILAEADGMLRIARQRMCTAYPFHANLLSEGRFLCDPGIPTMAVTVRDGRVTFLYSPSFVVTCSFPELMGVLHHEINHVLFGHIFADPTRFPDKEALVISEEVTVNEWVREPLPGEPITLADYPDLPVGEDTETRYRRLCGRDGKSGRSVPKTCGVVPKNPTSRTQKTAMGTETRATVRPLDDHDEWEEARKNPTLGRMAVRVAVRAARQQLSADQWNSLPDRLRRQIDRVAIGNVAGDSLEQVGSDETRAGVHWPKVLRRFVGRVFETRPVFNRPPRRFPDLVGVLPGRGRQVRKPKIMSVVDTSASLSTETLKRISAELNQLGRANDVVVVECDAAIQAVYPYHGPINQVRGRGGTDLRLVFATEFLRKHKPDLVIYFTDGHGPAPARRPPVPVIWCLTPDGRQPANWGNVVRLQ